MIKTKEVSYVSSSRSVSVRDISCYAIPRTKILRGDGVGVRAFTLIELLVVVLIIGILAAIALPQYQKAVYKSRSAEAISMLQSIHQAQEVYYLANGEYTDNLDLLDIEIPFQIEPGGLGNENYPNRYYYRCKSGRQAACSAVVFNVSMPNFEYSMEYRPAGLPNKFWCRVANSEGKNNTAKEICKSFAPASTLVDADWFNDQYFSLN